MSHYSHSSDLNVSYGRPSMTQFGSPRSSDANALGMTSSPSPNDISLIPTITHPESVYDRDPLTQNAVDNQPTAGRHRIRNWLTTAANAIGDAAHEKLDTSDYKDEVSFPSIRLTLKTALTTHPPPESPPLSRHPWRRNAQCRPRPRNNSIQPAARGKLPRSQRICR